MNCNEDFLEFEEISYAPDGVSYVHEETSYAPEEGKKRKNPRYCHHVKFTQEEDELLRQLVIEFGENDWRHLAKRMEGRNPRQCRDRWQNYLNPNLNNGSWTPEEDQLLLEKREELGPKWKLITTFFVNRTDSMIKTRYNSLIREMKKKTTSQSPDFQIQQQEPQFVVQSEVNTNLDFTPYPTEDDLFFPLDSDEMNFFIY